MDSLTLIDRFVEEELRARNRSAHTQAAYRRDLIQFCNYFAGSWRGKLPCVVVGDVLPAIDWRTLRSADVRGFLACLREQGARAVTMHRKVSALRTFFKYLRRNDLIDKVPHVELRHRSAGRSKPRVLFYDEVTRLLDDEASAADAVLRLRDVAMVELMYGTGMRVGTLARINVADLTFDPPTVRVLAKGNREQALPLGEQAVAALRAWLEVRGALFERPRRARDVVDMAALFVNRYGGRLTDHGVRMAVRRMTRGEGLGRVTPHTFRHTAATHLLERGADVRAIQELLGHASLRTTGRYTQLTVELVRRTYIDAHPRAGEP